MRLGTFLWKRRVPHSTREVCAAREIGDESPRGSMLRNDYRKERRKLKDLYYDVIRATIVFHLDNAGELVGSKTSSRSAYRQVADHTQDTAYSRIKLESGQLSIRFIKFLIILVDLFRVEHFFSLFIGC